MLLLTPVHSLKMSSLSLKQTTWITVNGAILLNEKQLNQIRYLHSAFVPALETYNI